MVEKLKGADSARWDKISRRYRVRHPLCRMCQHEGVVTLANCVDHIIPHKGNRSLLFDMNNLQSLCFNCHNSRKQRVDVHGYDDKINADGWPADPSHPANKKKKFF